MGCQKTIQELRIPKGQDLFNDLSQIITSVFSFFLFYFSHKWKDCSENNDFKNDAWHAHLTTLLYDRMRRALNRYELRYIYEQLSTLFYMRRLLLIPRWLRMSRGRIKSDIMTSLVCVEVANFVLAKIISLCLWIRYEAHGQQTYNLECGLSFIVYYRCLFTPKVWKSW